MSPTTGPAPLNWARNDEQTRERKRAHYASIIRSVIHRHGDKPDIALRLAIGESCNASSKADRELWIEEVNRQLEVKMEVKA